ncbi:MAG: hypothetical protein WAX04_06855, partial [Oscillospiraceae bacterium]
PKQCLTLMNKCHLCSPPDGLMASRIELYIIFISALGQSTNIKCTNKKIKENNIQNKLTEK